MFREIGYADELGSGMRNTNKYTKMYSGGTPSFEEGDIFVTTIPLTNIAEVKVGPKESSSQGVAQGDAQDVAQDVAQDNNMEEQICSLIKENKKITRKEMATQLGVSQKTIERRIRTMERVEFVGRGYSGYWIVKE